MSLGNPVIEDITRATIEKVAFIKLNQADHCENDATVKEYEENTSNSLALSSIRNVPMALQFLENALKQDNDDLLTWLGTNGFNFNYSNVEKQAILFIRLVLTDFYVNCNKPTLHNTLNERTTFVEYLVPVFKSFSAVFKGIAFQWCEKGLESNKCCDGVGYIMVGYTESAIIESSGENNKAHKEEDSIKMLECSVRTLKLEMEKLECVSFDTYKKRKVLRFLYTNDKITMLTTRVADESHWSFIKVREARIPRCWEARHQWLKVFELMFHTNEMLADQQGATNGRKRLDSGPLWKIHS